MKFARVVYRIAAIWGFVSLPPLYFLRTRLAELAPPALTHAEFYFGFIGLALLWQIVFVLISNDPMRYHPLILLTVLEKLVYSVPVVILYAMGELSQSMLASALVDPVLGALFAIAYVRTRV
jgi:hypothetical protein